MQLSDLYAERINAHGVSVDSRVLHHVFSRISTSARAQAKAAVDRFFCMAQVPYTPQVKSIQAVAAQGAPGVRTGVAQTDNTSDVPVRPSPTAPAAHHEATAGDGDQPPAAQVAKRTTCIVTAEAATTVFSPSVPNSGTSSVCTPTHGVAAP